MRWFRNLRRNKPVSAVKLAQTVNDTFFSWNGAVYDSDIVRSAITPFVTNIGKLKATHIRTTLDKDGKEITKVNPEPYLKFLLRYPNPYMSMQKLQERIASQLEINKNAFVLIVRDENDLPQQLYPVACNYAEAVYSETGRLYMRCHMETGDVFTFDYENLIFVACDVTAGSLFGRPILRALAPLMEVVTTTDQGMVHSIKNNAIIRWLLQTTSSQRTEHLQDMGKEFAEAFLKVDSGTGVAVVDSKTTATQIHPDNYVPNAAQQTGTKERIYSLFGTNEKIVQAKYTEEEFAAYFESKIEPVLVALQDEFTRKLFTRREIGCGNEIIFDASGIDSESTSTKLSYQAMVDRRSMTPNEWRRKWHWSPLPGGDDLLFWQAPNAAPAKKEED